MDSGTHREKSEVMQRAERWVQECVEGVQKSTTVDGHVEIFIFTL